jgi:hypothetical protein
MNPETILELVMELKALPFFPIEPAAHNAIVRLVGSMCHNEREARFLIARMTSGIYEVWPGPKEMRACFCHDFKPKDGINAYSSIYPDGLPPSKPGLLLESKPRAALPPGHGVTADKGLEAAVHVLAKTKELVNNLGGPATDEEIANAPRWLRRIEGYE